MLSNIIGMLYFILIPPIKLNRAYFISGIFQTLSGFIMVLSSYFPEHAKPIFIFGLIVFGFSRGAVACPYLLLIQFFNNPSDAVYVNIWFGLIELGIGWGFLLENWLLDSLMLEWETALIVLFLVFFMAVTLVFLVVPEVERERSGLSVM